MICYYSSMESPLGTIFMGTFHKKSISFLSFIRKDHNKYIREILTAECNLVKADLPVLSHLSKELKAYFEQSKVIDNSIKLGISIGSSFEKRVWEQTKEIPHGEVLSYREIAERVNLPKGARAVGNALGKNPIAILVPCHRVVRSNGEYGNYAYGSEMKEKLIRLEKGLT